MISKQHRFRLRVIVPVLLGVLVDVSRGMTSVQLIPQYPVIGGSVTLSVTGITGITGTVQSFSWYKGPNTNIENQILAYVLGNPPNLARGRLHNNSIAHFPNGSLQISNLNISNEGNYIVKIQAAEANDIPVYLKIYDMVEKPNITTSTSYPKENDAITLTCTSTNAEGIVWSRAPGSSLPSGATLSPDNKTVSFSRINRSHSGVYTCKASNPVSEKSISITITVAYGPENVKVIAKQSPSNSLIILECTAQSVPEATYHWRLNGTDIKKQQNQFQVDQKKAEEEGTYTCVANNSVTRLTASDSIYVNSTIEPEEIHDGNTGLTIGIVIAVILLLVLVAALVYLFVVHRRRKKLLKDQSSTNKSKKSRNGQTNPSEAAPEPELQYADIVFSKNIPRKQQSPPDVVYANRADLVQPQETVYSDLRLN